MASTVTSEMRPASSRANGFLNLAALLLIAVVIAILATVYLLRYEQSSAPASPAPTPYRALVVSGSQIWLAGPGVQPRLLPGLGVPGDWQGFEAAEDGSGLLVASKVSGQEAVFLARAFGRSAVRLATPSKSYGAGPWRVTNMAWVGSSDVVVLWSGGEDVVAWYSVDGAAPHAEQWIRAPAASGRALALSPDGLQVARIETLPPAKGFAGQVQVRLRQVIGRLSSVALQYLGSKVPSAVLWSSDGGTLAFEIPGQGLSIQKSSGRAVHQTSGGDLPAAFSPKGAAIAYVVGAKSSLRIHVLNLHGEVENVLALPAPGAVQALRWTPDARALVCTLGNVIYQIDPTTGSSQKLPGTVSGTLVGTIPASSLLVR
jgi:hypothetical protein